MDFSEQMLEVSLSSDPSSKGALTLRFLGELFWKKVEKNMNCDNILIFFGQIKKIAMAVSNILNLIACIKQAFFYD